MSNNTTPEYIKQMSDHERYIYSFVIDGADSYEEYIDEDWTVITHRSLVYLAEDDCTVLCVIRQCRRGRAWSYCTDIYSGYGDEPESIIVDGWCGEHDYHKIEAAKTWLSYSDMSEHIACALYDTYKYDGEFDCAEYKPAA